LPSKRAKKVDGLGDPGASLPVGDGVWILFALLGVYSVLSSEFRAKILE
jgi:hypothetical protein